LQGGEIEAGRIDVLFVAGKLFQMISVGFLVSTMANTGFDISCALIRFENN
jgi:hypothetical protein